MEQNVLNVISLYSFVKMFKHLIKRKYKQLEENNVHYIIICCEKRGNIYWKQLEENLNKPINISLQNRNVKYY